MDVNKAEVAKYVVQMQNGDGQAFEKLYNATNQSGYFTALKILKDEDEAQDVLQDSYVKVLEKINDIQNPESFVSWFHQIVANTAKNFLAKKKPSLFASDEEEQDYAEFTPDEDEVWQPEKNVDEDDVRRHVMQIIEGLSDEKRTCVLLYYYNEMSVADIAKSVGASENTVKARLFQARKDIRKEVEKLGKKNVSLRGVAPISVVIWALRMASQAEGAGFAAGPAAVAVMEGAAATASAGAALTAASGTASVSAGGLGAKIAAMTLTQKVIAGIATVGVVAGAATGTVALVHNMKDEPAAELTTESVEAFSEAATEVILRSMLTDTEETQQIETQTEVVETERVSEPTATTARETATEQTVPLVSDETAMTSTKPHVSGFTTPSTSAATKTETTTESTTIQKVTTTTTTTMTTTQAQTNGGSPHAYTPPAEPTNTVTTKSTTSSMTNLPETEKQKRTATVTVKYIVAEHDDSGTVEIHVQEGDAITAEIVRNAVKEKLAEEYGENIRVLPLAEINIPSAEADHIYSFEVNVFEV